MDQQLEQLLEAFWIVLPLMVLYVSLLFFGLWNWFKQKELLGQKRYFWLLVILLFSIIGPIAYLVVNHQLTREQKDLIEYDDWRD
ncbi:MAG: hypothetical protein ACFFAJ_08510 [Candidatus Hodarchaeota archaeon]